MRSGGGVPGRSAVLVATGASVDGLVTISATNLRDFTVRIPRGTIREVPEQRFLPVIDGGERHRGVEGLVLERQALRGAQRTTLHIGHLGAWADRLSMTPVTFSQY